jgi:hypothetical protein
MLNILEGFDIAAMGHNSADYCTRSSRRNGSRSPTRRLPRRSRGVPADLLRTLISKD